MRLRLTLSSAAAAAALALAGIAGAQTFPESTMPSTVGGPSEHSKLDKDKDGNISRKEAAGDSELTAKWSTLDVNRDGKLDSAEFAAFESDEPAESTSPSSASPSSDESMTDQDSKY